MKKIKRLAVLLYAAARSTLDLVHRNLYRSRRKDKFYIYEDCFLLQQEAICSQHLIRQECFLQLILMDEVTKLEQILIFLRDKRFLHVMFPAFPPPPPLQHPRLDSP
jgi:hypothetical protein